MKTVPLHGKVAAGRVALVDDGDYELVSGHRWWVSEAVQRPGWTAIGPYARTGIIRGGRRTSIGMHTLITGYARVDHENHNGLDNRRANLRAATGSQNNANMRKASKHKTSRFKGVSRHSTAQRWVANIMVDGHQRYLGYFDSELDAARAYDAAALEAWGEFACLNLTGASLNGP